MAPTATARHLSPWVATLPERPSSGRTLPLGTQDVVVVGAGLVGLTTGLLLRREGMSVTVLEAARVGHGVTTHSTVKVTVGHGTRYSAIADRLGEDAVKAYAEANAAGFSRIVDLADDLGIDCDLQRTPHVVYAREPEGAQRVTAEAALTGRLGLPVTVSTEAPLPFPVSLAAHYADQVVLHPGAYLTGLAEAFIREGGLLVEEVRATGLHEGAPCRLETTAGAVAAESVVVATHVPFLDRGGHFARLVPNRSYGIAGVLPPGVPAGATLAVDGPGRSTRTVDLDGERLLIVVGEGHTVGHDHPTSERWDRLAGWAAEHFGVEELRYRWSTQDADTLDHVPYAGWLRAGSHRLLTATGFGGWGMTNGTAAAMLLADLVAERDNRWAATFDARRLNVHATAKDLLGLNLHVGMTFVGDRLRRSPSGAPQDLRPGEAGVFEVGGKRAAAHRDDEGGLHVVSATCTHLGCPLQWNGAERSWDCPCHGSRFAPDGAVLHGPATSALAPLRDASGEGETRQ